MLGVGGMTGQAVGVGDGSVEVAFAVDASTSRSLVVFELDADRFALLGSQVRSALRAVAIAALPGAPSIVEGVVSVHGEIVPVLDVRRRFGFPAKPLRPDQHFLVAQAGARVIALRVDRVASVVSVGSDAIDPTAVVPGLEYLAGIARLPDGLLVIHDLERFLSLDEARQLDDAAMAERSRL
jgi:purine-binding chemotaxis protein CheW